MLQNKVKSGISPSILIFKNIDSDDAQTFTIKATTATSQAQTKLNKSNENCDADDDDEKGTRKSPMKFLCG